MSPANSSSNKLIIIQSATDGLGQAFMEARRLAIVIDGLGLTGETGKTGDLWVGGFRVGRALAFSEALGEPAVRDPGEATSGIRLQDCQP